MARVTIEDCVIKIPSRFNLVMLAARRSRDISAGAELTLERDRDKNPIVALREIAEETVPLKELEEAIVQTLQKFVESEEPEEEAAELGLQKIPDETSEESLEVSSNVSSGDTSEKAITNAAQEDAEVTEDVLSVHEGDEEAAEDGDALKETKDKA